jgi:hypothetical protein
MPPVELELASAVALWSVVSSGGFSNVVESVVSIESCSTWAIGSTIG